MSYATQAALAIDAAFQARIRVAMVTAAVFITNEAKGGRTDSVFNKRVAFAYQVLSNSNGYLDRMSWAVIANPAITAASTDTDLQNEVRSLWNSMSGVAVID